MRIHIFSGLETADGELDGDGGEAGVASGVFTVDQMSTVDQMATVDSVEVTSNIAQDGSDSSKVGDQGELLSYRVQI